MYHLQLKAAITVGNINDLHLHLNSKDTVVLLFAHKAEQEVKLKSFTGTGCVLSNKKVADSLLDYTLKECAKANLPVLPVYSDKQKGSTFGERLANAFLLAFEMGYQRVICIGSDCPTLTTADILKAHEDLKHKSIVLGPASDGGVYLIGIQKQEFEPEIFAHLNWQTEEVYRMLEAYAINHKACCIALSEKSDIDTSQDLVQVLLELPVASRLRKIILGILYPNLSFPGVSFNFISHALGTYLSNLPLRAPPVYNS